VPDEADATKADLIAALNRVGKVMAMNAVRGLEESEQIRVLSAAGYSPAEIGALLDKRPGTVSVALTRQRQKTGSPRKKTADRKSAKKTSRKRSGSKKTSARRKR
jgi:IS30 family transposase